MLLTWWYFDNQIWKNKTLYFSFTVINYIQLRDLVGSILPQTKRFWIFVILRVINVLTVYLGREICRWKEIFTTSFNKIPSWEVIINTSCAKKIQETVKDICGMKFGWYRNLLIQSVIYDADNWIHLRNPKSILEIHTLYKFNNQYFYL